MLSMTRHAGTGGGDYEIAESGGRQRHDMEASLVKSLRLLFVGTAIVGRAGACDQKDQRCRLVLQRHGIEQRAIGKEGIWYHPVRENGNASSVKRYLFWQICPVLARCSHDRRDVLVFNRIAILLGRPPTRCDQQQTQPGDTTPQ